MDPLTRYFYADGTVFDMCRSWPALAAQIRDLSQKHAQKHPQGHDVANVDKDVEGYLRYLAYVARIHRVTGPTFIYDRPPSWRSFLKVPFKDWFAVDGTRKMSRAIESFVTSPHLRQLLGRFATYAGASPYLAPQP